MHWKLRTHFPSIVFICLPLVGPDNRIAWYIFCFNICFKFLQLDNTAINSLEFRKHREWHIFYVPMQGNSTHDDVIKWKHFPRYWPFVRGIHRSPVNSPHKGQWRGALMFSLVCVWINGWVNSCEAGDLRRPRAHYDVIVMKKGTSTRMHLLIVISWHNCGHLFVVYLTLNISAWWLLIHWWQTGTIASATMACLCLVRHSVLFSVVHLSWHRFLTNMNRPSFSLHIGSGTESVNFLFQGAQNQFADWRRN